jgi:uncharacterized membrane protein
MKTMPAVEPYVIFSVLAALLFSLSGLISKYVSKHCIHDSWALLFYADLAFVPFLLLLPAFFPVSLPRQGWGFIALYAVTFFAGHLLFIRAIYRLDASTFAPFFQLQSGLIAVLAFLLLGERFAPSNYLFLAFMLAGAVVVTLDERMSMRSFFQSATLLIVLQQLLHAFSNICAGFALRSMNSFTFLFWGDLLVSLLALAAAPLAGVSRLRVRAAQVRPLFAAGLLSVSGAVLFFTAYESNVTLSSALALLSAPIILLLTVVSSVWRPELLEHHGAKVYLLRAIGVAMILGGALGIAR